jgi:hypothetical protein
VLISVMMLAVGTSETSVSFYQTTRSSRSQDSRVLPSSFLSTIMYPLLILSMRATYTAHLINHNYNTRRLCSPPPCYFCPDDPKLPPLLCSLPPWVCASSCARGEVLNPYEKIKKVKQSLYTPWRRLGGEEV